MAFENLEVWKRSARLSANIFKSLRDCPDFGFRDQITRSRLSIPSNIAEGMERSLPREKRRYLDNAKGSCGELRTQIYIGMEINHVSKDLGTGWVQETKEISAMLVGLIHTLPTADCKLST
ncbi:MAG: four helix bundle protein [Thiobacillus sp.]|nr:four helix bundle protein [Thiobacillus sp.]